MPPPPPNGAPPREDPVGRLLDLIAGRTDATKDATPKDARALKATLAESFNAAAREKPGPLPDLAKPPGEDKSTATSPAHACLMPALAALDWTGSQNHVAQALPHLDPIADVADLRSVLSRLNIATRPHATRLANLTQKDCPCIAETETGDVVVVFGVGKDGVLDVHDGRTDKRRHMDAGRGAATVYTLRRTDTQHTQTRLAAAGFLGQVLARFRPLIILILFLSFLVNLAALALPVFVMHVYDLGIGTRSPDVVAYLIMGALLVAGTELLLRSIRARAMAYFGARIDSLIGMEVFQQLLCLPLSMTESAPIDAQVARLKQFEGMRDLFTGPIATTLIDIPFILLYLIVIAVVAGHLVWIPATLIVVYAAMAVFALPVSRHHATRAFEARQKLQAMTLEMVEKRRTIDDVGIQRAWLERYERLSAESRDLSLSYRRYQTVVQTVAQSLMTVAAVATLGIGALWVVNGTISLGALIAVMALVWRLLGPVQQIFLSIQSIEQALKSMQQVDKLLRIKRERDPGKVPTIERTFAGQLKLQRVVVRYPQRAEPALLGLSLDVAPGEMIAITGRSGAGKTTLLHTILGLVPFQQGAVLVDGLDLRQIDPAEWRTNVSTVLEGAELFHGTVAQNLRFAAPLASDDDIVTAAGEAGIFDFSHLLPEGLDTRLTSVLRRDLPEPLRQRILLARAYVRRAPIYLFDNAAKTLDAPGDAAFQRKLSALKGTATVIFTSYRPSHMMLADRLVVLEEGQVAMAGPPAEVLAKMRAAS